jgi:hypothetical protein
MGFPIACIINKSLLEMLIWWIWTHNVIVADVSHIQDYIGKLDAK